MTTTKRLHNFLNQRYSEYFIGRPLPIFLKNGEIRLNWMPKSACSYTLLWAFACNDLLRESNNYHKWVHKYRIDHYYQSKNFKKSMANWRSIKKQNRITITVTRDPQKRLVSIFRHACRFPEILTPGNYTKHLFKNKNNGLTFLHFKKQLQMLFKLPKWALDLHIWPQYWGDDDKKREGRHIVLNADTHDLEEHLFKISEAFSLNSCDEFESLKNQKNILKCFISQKI